MILQALAVVVVLQAPPVTLETRMEPERMGLADRAELVITARHAEDVRLFFPAGPEVEPFRALGPATGPEQAIQDGQMVETWRLPITPLRLGRRKVPPIAIDYEDADANTGVVTTPPVAVNVEPRLDPTADEVSLRGNLGPFELLDTNWALILLLIGTAIIAVTSVITLFAVRYVSGLPRRGPPPPPPRPAHLVASERMSSLEQERLLPLGKLREFTYRVSEILREYLGLRWAVDTLELTTSELLGRMKTLDPRGLSVFELERFLQTTDLVKFANMTPAHRECEESLDSVKRMIEKTRRSDDEVRTLLAEHATRVRREMPADWKRRVTAHGMELALVGAALWGLGWWLWTHEWTPLGIGLVLGAGWTAFVLGRDGLHRRGPRRWVGLTLTPADPRTPMEPGALLVRNLPLLIPLVGHTVELVVMLYAADGRRIGDRMAGTRVVELGRVGWPST